MFWIIGNEISSCSRLLTFYAGFSILLLLTGQTIGGELPYFLCFLSLILLNFSIPASLFAGERETGTMEFLISLPVTRFRLWLYKTAAGLALVIPVIIIFHLVSLVFRPISSISFNDMVSMVYILPFAFGLAASTISDKSVTAVCGGFIFWSLSFWSLSFRGADLDGGGHIVYQSGLLALIMLAISCWSFVTVQELDNPARTRHAVFFTCLIGLALLIFKTILRGW